MKIKEMIKRLSKDQYEIDNTNFYPENKPFAITESTPADRKYKILTIDFGNQDTRNVELDWLLLILQEFYGKEYLIESLQKFKIYDDIKEVEIK